MTLNERTQLSNLSFLSVICVGANLYKWAGSSSRSRKKKNDRLHGEPSGPDRMDAAPMNILSLASFLVKRTFDICDILVAHNI